MRTLDLRNLPEIAAPSWLPAPRWLRPDDGDQIFGIEGIATYLEMEFLDVRTMIEMGRLPTGRAGRAHTARKTALARHFLATEAAGCRGRPTGPPPADLSPNGALGLLREQPAIAAYMGVSVAGTKHHRLRNGLPVFRIGKAPFARKASIDAWQQSVAGETRSTRRLAAIIDRRRTECAPGSIVGAAAIADLLGWTAPAVFRAIYAGSLPAFRVGAGWAADPAALAVFAAARGITIKGDA